MDTIDSARRSRNMRAIKSTGTTPEMFVRRIVRGMGIGYRLHRKDLPGTPDLTFATKRKIIFVHGCFWHQHSAQNCKRRSVPKTRQEYWIPKLQRNVLRDIRNLAELEKDNWKVLVVWECETRDIVSLESRLDQFLLRP